MFVGFVLLPVRPGVAALASDALIGATRVAGGLLVLLGVALAFFAVKSLGSSLTPLPHPRDDATLVETGAYRFARHPIYGGVVLIAAGVAVALLSWPHGLGALALLAFFTGKAHREEVWLRARFPSYAQYAARTRRFIPFLV
jgi:protein-S-isoprenylcysteine O-methyltransferase Ste14